jgi:hypothetical protein
MTARLSIGMIVGTGFTTVIFAILFYSIISRNNTQARLTGTFHRSYGTHDFFGDSVLTLIITYEHIFRYF